MNKRDMRKTIIGNVVRMLEQDNMRHVLCEPPYSHPKWAEVCKEYARTLRERHALSLSEDKQEAA